MMVHHFLEVSAARWPDKVAIKCGDRRLTYAQLDLMANRLAAALVAGGLCRGDRVAIVLPNSLEAVVGMFGVLKAGGVFVAISSATKYEKLCYILNNSRAVVLLMATRSNDDFDPPKLLQSVPSLRLVVLSEGAAPVEIGQDSRLLSLAEVLARTEYNRPSVRGIDLDLACLIYTSGTTGEPKGVICDHASMVFATEAIVAYLENQETDVILNVLPISFSYGLYHLLTSLRSGATLVLEGSFAYPALIPKIMEAEKVTGFGGVPMLYAHLIQMDLSAYDLSALRYLTNAAAPLSIPQIQRIRRQFPQAKFYSMYGQTETVRTLYLDPCLVDQKPGSVGQAIPGTEVWLEDEGGRRVGAGEVGELVVRGRHVMRGYWESPEATAMRFRPGAFPGERLCHSGDLFRTDTDGDFYFVSRKDDIIKSRGEKVSPKEVENVLYGIPGVMEAAVIGVPDPFLGQAIKAFLVCRGEPPERNAVVAHCRKYLEDFMVPKQVEFLAALPKTASGKIKKNELK